MASKNELLLPPVLAWRELQFLRLGIEEQLALELALTLTIDVHAYAELLAAGCPPETAERILR